MVSYALHEYESMYTSSHVVFVIGYLLVLYQQYVNKWLCIFSVILIRFHDNKKLESRVICHCIKCQTEPKMYECWL